MIILDDNKERLKNIRAKLGKCAQYNPRFFEKVPNNILCIGDCNPKKVLSVIEKYNPEYVYVYSWDIAFVRSLRSVCSFFYFPFCSAFTNMMKEYDQ